MLRDGFDILLPKVRLSCLPENTQTSTRTHAHAYAHACPFSCASHCYMIVFLVFFSASLSCSETSQQCRSNHCSSYSSAVFCFAVH